MSCGNSVPFDLVIFDCDGVLVDSEPIANTVFAEMLNELGLTVTLQDMYRDFMGRSMSTCLQIIESRIGQAPPTEFVLELTRRIEISLSKNLKPVDGITDALERISAPCCVASSGDHEKMRLTLGLTGLLDRFEGKLFSVTQVAKGKPHPDVFLYAAEKMGAEPSQTAVIEDTEIGVAAGVSAGMTVFGYAGISDSARLSAAGAIVFDNMKLLPEILCLRNSTSC